VLAPRRIETHTEADLEQLLERVDEAVYQALNGGGRQTAACQFVIYLRRQGFLPTQRFARQFLQRVRSRGPQFDPQMFGNEFYRARHYRRQGYFTRIAVVQGVPVLYRMAGEGTTRSRW